MKSLLFILTVLSSLSARSQTDVDKIMERATCDCISKLLETQEKSGDSFNACYLKSLGKDTVLIKNECKRLYGDTSAEASYKFGKEFYQRKMVSLVYSCDTYFKMMDSIRYSQIYSIDKDSLRFSIASMNLTDSNARDNNFFATRGMFYFALTDYANAEKDLNASLAIDSNTVQGIYFKAWILEIKKDYDGANRLYTYLATLTKTNEFNIFAAIANRKKNGR
jgi:tetratricopeptide (TPR) repeat protein